MKKEFKIIADLIEKKSRVLDVGSGDGELMSFILNNISEDVRGIETSNPARSDDLLAISATRTTTTAVSIVLINKYHILFKA